MKKMIACLLALIMILSFTACGSTADPQSGKTLSIATSPDFPPFESLDGSGNVVGIEIELLGRICDEMMMTLEINQMDFDSVLPGVQAGKFMLGVSGITVNEERQKNALFTDPYCLAAQAIVVTGDSDIKTKADLEGKVIAVQTGTTAESYCLSEGYEVSSYVANNDAQSALLAGKVDAWVIDDLTAADMVKVYNGSDEGALVILPEVMTSEPYAFASAFGNEELIEQINEVLDKLIEDGTVAAIFEKYGAPYTSPK